MDKDLIHGYLRTIALTMNFHALYCRAITSNLVAAEKDHNVRIEIIQVVGIQIFSTAYNC